MPFPAGFGKTESSEELIRATCAGIIEEGKGGWIWYSTCRKADFCRFTRLPSAGACFVWWWIGVDWLFHQLTRDGNDSGKLLGVTCNAVAGSGRQ